MSIAGNKQIVLDFCKAGAHGGLDACFELLADDIRWPYSTRPPKIVGCRALGTVKKLCDLFQGTTHGSLKN
jgi:ketosteroid isomerase-like protein